MDSRSSHLNWCLLTARRDKQAALCIFRKSIRQHGLPLKVAVDQSGANTAATLEALKEATGQAIEIRQSKYLNNLIEQDHQTIKRIIRPMLGFKTFDLPCVRISVRPVQF